MKRARNSMFGAAAFRIHVTTASCHKNGIPGKRSDEEEVVVGRNPLLETIAWFLDIPARD